MGSTSKHDDCFGSSKATCTDLGSPEKTKEFKLLFDYTFYDSIWLVLESPSSGHTEGISQHSDCQSSLTRAGPNTLTQRTGCFFFGRRALADKDSPVLCGHPHNLFDATIVLASQPLFTTSVFIKYTPILDTSNWISDKDNCEAIAWVFSLHGSPSTYPNSIILLFGSTWIIWLLRYR